MSSFGIGHCPRFRGCFTWNIVFLLVLRHCPAHVGAPAQAPAQAFLGAGFGFGSVSAPASALSGLLGFGFGVGFVPAAGGFGLGAASDLDFVPVSGDVSRGTLPLALCYVGAWPWPSPFRATGPPLRGSHGTLLAESTIYKVYSTCDQSWQNR